MRDAIRVTVEADQETTSVRVHDDAGEVTAGDATLRFRVDGADADHTEPAGAVREDDPDTTGEADARHIAPVAEIPTDSTLRCEALQDGYGVGIILRREGDDVFAWRNSCPHKPEVPLDPGRGAIVSGDQIVCHEHGARFECDDGFCTYGPCQGEMLDEIDLDVRDGDVYLADERFEACTRLD